MTRNNLVSLTDTHCHIQSIGSSEGEEATLELWAKHGQLNPDAVIERARQAEVDRLICVGCNLADSFLAAKFVHHRLGCWAAVGIHPHEADQYVNDHNLKTEFGDLLSLPKVVAIGECGLDYYYQHSTKKAQQQILSFQIEMALSYDLPMIFHVRQAYKDFWPIFDSYNSRAKPIRAVLHSFTDSLKNLEVALNHNLLIGVNGIATFTKDNEQLLMYKAIPLANLVLETDSPFLTPVPYRGNICEPYHIKTIAEFMSKLLSVPLASLAQATTSNAQQLFGL